MAIEKACCAGLGYSEAARRFGVSVFAVMARSKRNGWPVGNRIQRRLEALQEARYKARERYKPYEQQRDSNAQVTEAIAESWAEKGEAHRSLVYGMTNTALKKVAKNPPPLESWSDVERADKAGRRACGLDDSEAARNVSIGMQLIEFRLANIHLPPDAPEAFKEPPEDASGIVHGQDVTTPDCNRPRAGSL